MLSTKNVSLSGLVKSAAVILSTLFVTTNFADDQQSLELAAVSDGFDVEATYMASCFACHSTGAAGAPKVGAGNAAAWAPRLEKGLDAVVQNAINGLNTMPPKGLCFTCTDDDLRALVEYMVDSSTE